MLFLASVQWHCQDIFPRSYEIQIMTRYLFKKFESSRLLLMGMFCFFQMFIALLNVRHGRKVQWPCLVQVNHNKYKKQFWALAFGRLIAWGTYVVCKMIVKTLCVLIFATKSFQCGECTHIPVVGQMVLTSSTSLHGCKFYHGPPFYVTYYNG